MKTISDMYDRVDTSGWGPGWSGPDPTLSSVASGVARCQTGQTISRDRVTATRPEVVTADRLVMVARFQLSRAPLVGELTHGFHRTYSPGYTSFMELVHRPGQLPAIQVQTMHQDEAGHHFKTTEQNIHLDLGAATAPVWFKFRQTGRTVALKAWVDGDPEPGYQRGVRVPAWAAQPAQPAILFGHGDDEPGLCDHLVSAFTAQWQEAATP